MRAFIEKDLPRLLDLLYDAALDPDGWQKFLDALPGPFGGACGVLLFYEVTTRGAPSFRNFGGDPEFTTSFANHFASINPYPLRGFENMPVGQTIYATEFLEAEVLKKTEFYSDWMRPQGITADHLTLALNKTGGSGALISIAPHASVYRNQRDAYRQRLSLLAPHLMRAVEIGRVIAAAHQAERTIVGGLDALRLAAFLTEGSGALCV